MKIKFLDFFGNKWKFQKAALTESVAELHNPVRGWYQIHTFLAEEKFSKRDMEWCMNEEDSLALVLIDIGAYKERNLDEACLANINEILHFFVNWPLDIILRVVYDHEGKAQEREPFFFMQVAEHLAQMGPILGRYAEHIFVYQGLLVGNWGEMHTSRFLTTDKLSRLSSLLNGYLGEHGFLAVRRPMYWRLLHPEVSKQKDFSRTRMGLFDDAIFGSATHLGTFGTKPESEMGWDDPWLPDEELSFEEKLCRYAPQGGEAVYEQDVAENRSLSDTVEHLRRMNVTYLNRIYDERLLNLWRQMTWKGSGPWAGMNGFDYIGRHLGYRFCVRSVTVTFLEEKKDTCHFEIHIENVGFARCYQSIETWIEWRDAKGEVWKRELDMDLSYILPGEVKKGTCTAIPAIGNIYLYARRQKDEVPVYFANETEGKRGVLLGRLDQ